MHRRVVATFLVALFTAVGIAATADASYGLVSVVRALVHTVRRSVSVRVSLGVPAATTTWSRLLGVFGACVTCVTRSIIV